MIRLNEGIFDDSAGKMKTVIFLDIDGVLANSECFKSKFMEDDEHPFSESCMKILNKLVFDTDCHIVITSSWRRSNLEWIRKVFESRGFHWPIRIVGETMRAYNFVHKGVHLPICRGEEIKAWIDKFVYYKKGVGFVRNPEFRYCIIDDDSDMLLCQKDNFVRTNTEKGLTRKDANKVVKILNG